ncbi:MAG: KTSC domain-containing protein, partial [Gammaproteobacteria bacterium]|nr:KTSC domain-containing protein [Gammaproteobacteria bacterium]
FKKGRIYQYFDVPADVHRALRNASSHGKFLNQQIKGSYRYARV